MPGHVAQDRRRGEVAADPALVERAHAVGQHGDAAAAAEVGVDQAAGLGARAAGGSGRRRWWSRRRRPWRRRRPRWCLALRRLDRRGGSWRRRRSPGPARSAWAWARPGPGPAATATGGSLRRQRRRDLRRADRAGRRAPARCASVGWLRRFSRGERSARRSVVLTSASVSRSACLGVTSSVAVAYCWPSGEGVAWASIIWPIESTCAPRMIVAALGASSLRAGVTAMTSTRSPAWIRLETPLTRSSAIETARMPTCMRPTRPVADGVGELRAGQQAAGRDVVHRASSRARRPGRPARRGRPRRRSARRGPASRR